jgi:pSer/pThr/pTyr-binding forkhead associated (FHA) protein
MDGPGDPYPHPVALGPGRTVFGRADWLAAHHPDAAVVVLPSPAVAKAHAVVTRTPDGCVLEDLNTRNGTYVNGARVAGPVTLRDGDEVRFPAFAFVFREAP